MTIDKIENLVSDNLPGREMIRRVIFSNEEALDVNVAMGCMLRIILFKEKPNRIAIEKTCTQFDANRQIEPTLSYKCIMEGDVPMIDGFKDQVDYRFIGVIIKNWNLF